MGKLGKDIPNAATKTAPMAQPTLILSPAWLARGIVGAGATVVGTPKPVEATTPDVGLFVTKVLLLHEAIGDATSAGADGMRTGAEVTAAEEEMWVMAGQLVTAAPHEVMVTILVL